MHNDEIIRVGSNVLLMKDGKILMGKRKGKFGDGTYGVPGGHVKFGESPEECIRRELLEETGLTPQKLEFVTIINQPLNEFHQHYIQFVFFCDQFQGELENREPESCHGWEWVDIQHLPENIFIAHKDFIPAYLNKQTLLDPD